MYVTPISVEQICELAVKAASELREYGTIPKTLTPHNITSELAHQYLYLNSDPEGAITIGFNENVDGSTFSRILTLDGRTGRRVGWSTIEPDGTVVYTFAETGRSHILTRAAERAGRNVTITLACEAALARISEGCAPQHSISLAEKHVKVMNPREGEGMGWFGRLAAKLLG